MKTLSEVQQWQCSIFNVIFNLLRLQFDWLVVDDEKELSRFIAHYWKLRLSYDRTTSGQIAVALFAEKWPSRCRSGAEYEELLYRLLLNWQWACDNACASDVYPKPAPSNDDTQLSPPPAE